MSISANEFFQENDGSDSDAADSDAPSNDAYRPISALSDDDGDNAPTRINGPDLVSHPIEFGSISFPNPNIYHFSNGIRSAENGISNLNMNEDNETDDGDDDEEEERMRRSSELAIARAFREDDSRRNVPLTPENASRIMNAMRGVSFRGFPPDWASHLSEDQWRDQLRRLRDSATSQN